MEVRMDTRVQVFLACITFVGFRYGYYHSLSSPPDERRDGTIIRRVVLKRSGGLQLEGSICKYAINLHLRKSCFGHFLAIFIWSYIMGLWDP